MPSGYDHDGRHKRRRLEGRANSAHLTGARSSMQESGVPGFVFQASSVFGNSQPEKYSDGWMHRTPISYSSFGANYPPNSHLYSGYHSQPWAWQNAMHLPALTPTPFQPQATSSFQPWAAGFQSAPPPLYPVPPAAVPEPLNCFSGNAPWITNVQQPDIQQTQFNNGQHATGLQDENNFLQTEALECPSEDSLADCGQDMCCFGMVRMPHRWPSYGQSNIFRYRE